LQQAPIHERRKVMGTSKPKALVPLFDLKFLDEYVACTVGTSNRRHWPCFREANVKKPKPHDNPIFPSSPLIPTFVKSPAEKGYKCQKRTTSQCG
jgi:hypothetical protein